MIPDFKTYIKESVWSDIQDRSTGDQIKLEDDPFNFNEEFKKIEKMELICPTKELHKGVNFLWTPYNFGSEDYEQPGRYLNAEEIIALYDFLKNTEYSIAYPMAFQMLIDSSDKGFEYKKIGKYWNYIFENSNNEMIYIPNFGYYSVAQPEKVIIPTMKDLMTYGYCFSHNVGFITLKKELKTIRCSSYVTTNPTSHSDRLQVRLVKRIHK